jgi:hypothetical protein
MASETRIATDADLDGVTATLTAAFATDPLWSWAFPDPRDLAVWWRYCIASALRYPWVWISGECAAVSVWIPPDGIELTDEEARGVEPLIRDLIGARCDDVIELLDRFEASHPRDEPQGLGMALLSENLIRTDAEDVPAFLESSNPANNPRYEQLGFRQVGEFTTPDGACTVATMWREVGAEGPPE